MSELEGRAERSWCGDNEHCKETKGMDLGWVFATAWRNRVVEEVGTAMKGTSSRGEETDVTLDVVITRKRRVCKERGVLKRKQRAEDITEEPQAEGGQEEDRPRTRPRMSKRRRLTGGVTMKSV